MECIGRGLCRRWCGNLDTCTTSDGKPQEVPWINDPWGRPCNYTVGGADYTKPDPQLCKFYAVSTYPELVAAMERHIAKLQAKLPQAPSFAPQSVREG
jgi:hypothetical protein